MYFEKNYTARNYSPKNFLFSKTSQSERNLSCVNCFCNNRFVIFLQQKFPIDTEIANLNKNSVFQKQMIIFECLLSWIN